MIKAFIICLFIIAFSFLPSKAFAQQFSETPVEIIIPSLHLDLPVTTAKIVYDTWEVNEVGASFGEGTTIPGNEGNTVIFAHDRPNLFQTLSSINKGDYINVFTNNDWFVYKVYETKIVDPSDVNVLIAQKNHMLTLFSCIGVDYSKRYIVKA